MSLIGQIKSVILNGQIDENENQITLKLLPNELSTGTWNICIQSMAYTLETEQNLVRNLYSLNCNLVTSQKFSKNGSTIENYEQPLAIFLLDGKIKKKLFAFDKCWFHVNVYSNELVIKINKMENELRNPKFFVFIVLLFQRIK